MIAMAGLVPFPGITHAASLTNKAGPDSDAIECMRRMGLIWEAIGRWKRIHGLGAWPDHLRVLREEGILNDPRIWNCPIAERMQEFRFDPKNRNVISVPSGNPESNINYEFNFEPAPGPSSEGLSNRIRYKDWKTKLTATEIGGKVPVLRCGSHTLPSYPDRKLNMGADGRGYESGLYWEYLFSHLRPEPYCMPWMVNSPLKKSGLPRIGKMNAGFIGFLRDSAAFVPWQPPFLTGC